MRDLTHELLVTAENLQRQVDHLNNLVLQQWNYKSIWIANSPLGEATLGVLTKTGPTDFTVNMIDKTQRLFKFEDIKSMFVCDNRLTIVV